LPTLSQPMIDALRRIGKEADPTTGVVERMHGVTPGTLRGMERRGLIQCDRFYATDAVSLTDAGRAALAANT